MAKRKNTYNTNGTSKRVQIMANESAYASRREYGGRAGFQYDGDRDIYDTAGYPQRITFEDYNAKYERQDIAGRIVDAPAISTWQESPEIQDGELGETDFIRAWNELVSINALDIEDQKTVWHYCERVDKLAGIGSYGALLLGVGDGLPLSEPIARNGAPGLKNFLYLSPYHEGDAQVKKLNEDTTSRRFNLPETYEIQLSDISGLGTTSKRQIQEVHWTRIIHIADGLKQDEIYGTPRLKKVYNRLNDLEKVLAGSSEAAWRLAYKGLVFTTKDGYTLDADTTTTEKMKDFVHDLTRVLELQGMDVTVLGGEMVDPTGLVKIIISIIAAQTGIPQRILLGSEAGHLASEQDERNWAQRIMSRRTSFADPIILRPLISRLIYCGVLPVPASGDYQIKWGHPIQANEQELAQQRLIEAQAIATAVNAGFPLEAYLKYVLEWDQETIANLYNEPPGVSL